MSAIRTGAASILRAPTFAGPSLFDVDAFPGQTFCNGGINAVDDLGLYPARGQVRSRGTPLATSLIQAMCGGKSGEPSYFASSAVWLIRLCVGSPGLFLTTDFTGPEVATKRGDSKNPAPPPDRPSADCSVYSSQPGLKSPLGSAAAPRRNGYRQAGLEYCGSLQRRTCPGIQ